MMLPVEDSRSNSKSSPSGDGNGLFDGFEAYKTASEADYQRVLTSGIVVPDANVFLNLYRYNEQTRNDLFAILQGLGERLWVPHQVIEEFWRNREAVLRDPRDTSTTAQELEGQRDKSIDIIRSWANRVSLSRQRTEKLTQALSAAFTKVITSVSELTDSEASDFIRNTDKDPVLLRLEPIIRGRVGNPLSEEDFSQAVAEAKSRAESKIPPGYKDIGKDPILAAGDYIVWIQTIAQAEAHNKDVLFVTGDVKEDWWRKSNGELRGPRVELVKELKERSSRRLFMLRPESLLLHARQALKINISDESVQDIERVEQLSASKRSTITDGPEGAEGQWTKILEAVRERRKVAWLLLSSADFVHLDDDVLEIRFKRQNEAKAFHDGGHRRQLQDALTEVVGTPMNLVVTSPTTFRTYPASGGYPQRPAFLTPGDKVTHDTYGTGVVISTAGTSDDPEAKIDFGELYGIRHLVLRYAPISKL